MKKTRLSDTSRNALSNLDRLQFATCEQLRYWVDVSQPTMSITLSKLASSDYVKVDKSIKPFIYSLTQSGRRAIGTKAPKKAFYSTSVMRHTCHRNQAEIVLRGVYERMTFQSRKVWFKKGLNPAHGEHGAKDLNGYTLVLLDDYLMDSYRIGHSWTRPHAANERYWADSQIRHWRDVVDRYLVVTTDEGQRERHLSFIEKSQLSDTVNILHVEPLWENVC